MPALFGNVLRLDHLDACCARSAIVGPLRAYAELGGAEVTAEAELVEAVLDEVAAGRIERQPRGRGLVDGRQAGADASRRRTCSSCSSGSGRSSAERARTCCAPRRSRSWAARERIVEEHLERALAGLDGTERDLVARLFNHLVTPSGTKIAHAVDDLARYAAVEPARLEPVLASAR